MTDEDTDSEDGEEQKTHADDGGFLPGHSIGAPEGNTNGVGHGPPKGNKNAVGNDGGAPVGNKNGMTHGLYAVERAPGEVADYLEEEEPEAYEWVCDKAAGYLEEAPFTQDSPKFDQLLQICTAEHCIWKGRGIQVKDGLVVKTHKRTPDGDLVEVEDENPVNKAVDRMESRVTQRLKKLGIYDNNDSGTQGQMSNEHYSVVDAEGGTVSDSEEE